MAGMKDFIAKMMQTPGRMAAQGDADEKVMATAEAARKGFEKKSEKKKKKKEYK